MHVNEDGTVVVATGSPDIGGSRAIHPNYVEGQIQGGVTQGIGWALNEEYIYDSRGRMENPGFLDYRIPVSSDLPMIEPVICCRGWALVGSPTARPMRVPIT